MPPSITIEHLNLTYHEQSLFDSINLHIPSGQWLSLLGRSGCGKTTILHLLAGLDTGGELDPQTKIQGLGKHQVSLMTQRDCLLPWLSTLDNVLITHKLTNTITANLKQQAIELLEHVGLSSAIHKRPKQLSGGMRQRAALARVLLENKPIVLMDEPFSALDAITRFNMQNLSLELLKDKTVLLVTHDPLEALRLSNQIYVLQGTPAKLMPVTMPNTQTPREIDDPAIKDHYATLLKMLL